MRFAALLAGLVGAQAVAGADTYVVSQFDPAEDEYVRLGTIEGMPTDESAVGYYGFTPDDPDPDLPPGAPELVSDRSHLWVIESAVDGVAVLFIHDAEKDGSGGHAETAWSIANDPDGAAWLVQDGPPGADEYTGEPGESAFAASQDWPVENVDGGVIGSLDGCWAVTGGFADFGDGEGNEIEGLVSWAAYSDGGGAIELTLDADRPVRVEPVTADCNADGTLNVLDFVCFQGEWEGATAYGDCDDNGVFNILDFVCFQGLFEAGCP